MSQQVFAIPASPDAYIRHGWSLVPISPGSKGPKTPDWNKRENCLTIDTTLPPGYGIGLAHAYSGTMALDIDHWETASFWLMMQGINLQELYDAPDAVTIDSGNKGHGKLIYTMPFGLALNSKKLIETAPDGTKYNFLDFRCSSSNNLTVQDVLPPSIHPSTCRPYQWGGKGNWQRLPTIPMPLLALWQNLLESDNKRTLKTDTKHDASWTDVRSALSAISPDCNRDQWVQIGMALHSGGSAINEIDTAYQIFDEWSSQGTKYRGPTDINNCWRSFKPDGNITLGTLFHHALEAGYRRPMPDVASLFGEVTQTPEAIIDDVTFKLQPPECDLSMFPKLLAQRADEIGVSVGCDPVIPLMAGLATVCAAADKRTRLELMQGYQVPPVLWLMTIGDPSDRKTPGASPMFRVLNEIERENVDRFKAEHLMWKGKEAAHAASLKAFLEHSAQALTTNTVAPTVLALPDEPKPTRLIVTDSTSQKIVHLAAGRPRGFLLNMDEMGHWINKINDPRGGDDRGCWIAGYESRSYTMDRVGTGTVHADNLGVAIYGNIQPKVFKNTVAKMSEDGLLQRFIPVSVRGDKTRLNNPIPDFLTNRAEYEETIRKIYAMPERTYRLSNEAYQSYRAFQQWYLDLRQDERLVQADPVYMTALGKIEGTCGRVALAFHLVENANSDSVSGETMDRAIATIKCFVIPNLKHAFANEEDSIDRWVFDYVVQNAGIEEALTVAEVRRAGRRQFAADTPPWLADQMVRIVFDKLAKAGWTKLTEDNRHCVKYAINPAVAEIYADYRLRILNAKQAIKQRSIDIVESNGVSYNRPRYIKGYIPQLHSDATRRQTGTG